MNNELLTTNTDRSSLEPHLLKQNRRYATGPEPVPGGVHFRVWAPTHNHVELLLVNKNISFELKSEGNGYFSGLCDAASPNDLYFYRLDGDQRNLPDPASRFQPQGVHGPSQVIDAAAYQWGDSEWRGVHLKGQVICELHIGCYTTDGTWDAAIEKLQHLADTGITTIEVMPVAAFNGNFGWGYDGVFWYAPTHLYGTPDQFRRFVDVAHQKGLAVILDVVYNHFGPTGNYNSAFSPYFRSERHPTEWGEAINYDGEQAQGVRDFVTQNAAYWIADFHLDGLRLDATQAIYDDSRRHILADLNTAARAAAGSRAIIIVAENEEQDIIHVEPQEQDGFGLDGVWNDDFHHAARVAATGHAEHYYADYSGTPSELISATKWGYLYQGQYACAASKWRGTPALQTDAWRFVNCLQNHDQVANSAHGLRLNDLSSPGRYRALTTLLLLGPATPMLFMGQEFATSTPFLYFADHEVDLAELVKKGRWEGLRRFPRIAGREGATVSLADPSNVATFKKSKINWDELTQNQADWQLHHDLLKLRRSDPTFSAQDCTMVHGTVVGPEAFMLRWINSGTLDRLLIVSLGRDMPWKPTAEPLIAAPRGQEWQVMFSSDDEIYGGSGTAMLNIREWYLPGHAAILLSPRMKVAS